MHEARLFHAFARTSQSAVEVKGGNPLTENYSVLRPEVLEDASGTPIDSPNRALVDHLLSFDTVAIDMPAPLDELLREHLDHGGPAADYIPHSHAGISHQRRTAARSGYQLSDLDQYPRPDAEWALAILGGAGGTFGRCH